jgi:hypothetical protein
MPENLDIESKYDQTTIRYKWYKPSVWFLCFFAIFWNVFLVFWFLAPTPWFFKAFALIHAGVGIWLIWAIITMFTNTTTIIITPRDLTITHAPLYMYGYENQQIYRSDIQQVYIHRKISRNKNSTSISFELKLLDTKNKSKTLSIDGEEFEKAIFIKRKIEEIMQITPMAIEGEYLGG